jgi:hypothetical protein
MTRAGVIAATSGALLVVSLLLTWWGVPPWFIDPSEDLPAELEFVAEGDLPFGREIGGWIGVSAALGVTLGAGLVLRGQRS